MNRPYVPELDSDVSYIPPEFWEDELIILDNSDEPCYNCNEMADFYNATVGRYECDLHTSDMREEENA